MASLKKRGKNYYAQDYVGSRQLRVSLHTTSLQVAKEKFARSNPHKQGEPISLCRTERVWPRWSNLMSNTSTQLKRLATSKEIFII